MRGSLPRYHRSLIDEASPLKPHFQGHFESLELCNIHRYKKTAHGGVNAKEQISNLIYTGKGLGFSPWILSNRRFNFFQVPLYVDNKCLIFRTLPLSGRQGAWGGEAES